MYPVNPTQIHAHFHIGKVLLAMYRALALLAPEAFLRTYFVCPQPIENDARRSEEFAFWHRAAKDFGVDVDHTGDDPLDLIDRIIEAGDEGRNNLFVAFLQRWIDRFLPQLEIDVASVQRSWRSSIVGQCDLIAKEEEILRWGDHKNPSDFTIANYRRCSRLCSEFKAALIGVTARDRGATAARVAPIVREIAEMFRNAWEFASCAPEEDVDRLGNGTPKGIAAPTKQTRATRENTWPAIKKYLTARPNDCAEEVARQLGCSKAFVIASEPWKNQMRLRNGAKQKSVSTSALSFEEHMVSQEAASPARLRESANELDAELDAQENQLMNQIGEYRKGHPDHSPQKVAKALDCCVADVNRWERTIQSLEKEQAEDSMEESWGSGVQRRVRKKP